MSFRSIDHLLDAGREMPLWRAVLEDDCRDRGVAQTDSMERMEGPVSYTHLDVYKRQQWGRSGR